MSGRSHCDGCGKTLKPHELIPILSYLIQRGKCRECGAPIGRDALVIELLAAAIGAVALFILPDIHGLTGAIFGWLLLTLAWLDVRHFWVPDRLTLPLAIGGIGAAYLFHSDQFVHYIIGGVAGFLLLWIISWGYKLMRGREGLGGGDPKMLGAIGFWLGWPALPFILLGASVFGLGIATILLLMGRKVESDTRLPLGALMAAPAFIYWLVVH